RSYRSTSRGCFRDRVRALQRVFDRIWRGVHGAVLLERALSHGAVSLLSRAQHVLARGSLTRKRRTGHPVVQLVVWSRSHQRRRDRGRAAVGGGAAWAGLDLGSTGRALCRDLRVRAQVVLLNRDSRFPADRSQITSSPPTPISPTVSYTRRCQLDRGH